MSLASVDNPFASTRLCVLRALSPSEAYPRFNFSLALEGTRYDVVVPSAVADWLDVCCTREGILSVDDLPGTDTPEDLRAVIVRETSRHDTKDRQLFGSLQLEVLTHVHAERLCEMVEYRYVFGSQGLARQLCRDAEADRLALELSNYVMQHQSLFIHCGGFELLIARYQAFSADEYIALDTPASSPPPAKKLRERRAFLRGLL